MTHRPAPLFYSLMHFVASITCHFFDIWLHGPHCAGVKAQYCSSYEVLFVILMIWDDCRHFFQAVCQMKACNEGFRFPTVRVLFSAAAWRKDSFGSFQLASEGDNQARLWLQIPELAFFLQKWGMKKGCMRSIWSEQRNRGRTREEGEEQARGNGESAIDKV